jgi:hypothetical protein
MNFGRPEGVPTGLQRRTGSKLSKNCDRAPTPEADRGFEDVANARLARQRQECRMFLFSGHLGNFCALTGKPSVSVRE